MLSAERQREILRLIRERRRATVAELSERFGVSPATVRRDLDALEDEGVIRRSHGGAVVAERATPEPPIIQRMMENEEEKRRIGQAAAKLIQDGETIFLGSGTTTFEVARHLTGKKNLTVITNALNIVNLLADQPEITVVVTGGLLRHSELSMIGHITEQTLKELRANKVIMGMRAISVQDGLTSDYLPETMTDRAIIQSASEVILVADHSKFGKVSTVLVAPVTAVHKVVTDSAAPSDIVAELRRLGIEVILT
ncbi:MAG: DeoR/GlpR transcriptional regulator [Chloroflexi bacterium]|nr:DeoR/GlpR transcriptional regulator [Chloroflexota bacterium]